MKIGIVIGRIGGIDGVALETEKWIDILKILGHQIHIITGRLESKIDNVTILPELEFSHPANILEQNDAFFNQNIGEKNLIGRLISETTTIENGILKWIIKNSIDVILSENSSALPCHLRMGWAISNIARSTNIPMVTHDHDFAWERDDRYKTKYHSVKKIIRESFPLIADNVRHGVINLNAQKVLKSRFKTDSIVVPNVMDFKIPYGIKDSYNSTLRQDLKVAEDDILLFQITRIVRRKGIEIAIDLIHELGNPKIKLIITGSAEDDHKDLYLNELKDRAKRVGVHKQITFAANLFDNFRGKRKNGKKTYSLSDAYAHANACTYFSTYEGFGNAFVECVLSKTPIFVNDYKPVYMPDIGSKGFDAVMLTNNKLTSHAVKEIKEILSNPQKQSEIITKNFALGKKFFSYEILEKRLKELFKF